MAAAAPPPLLRINKALAELSKTMADSGVDLESALRAAVRLSAKVLPVERVGVWWFEQDRQVLSCIQGYSLKGDRFSSGQLLEARDYPEYFRSLEHNRFIAADDARTDPRTAEFTDHYLEPHGITSMLDAPIFIDGVFEGVLCHEHTGERREWSLEEKVFAGAVADLIALGMQTNFRRNAEIALGERDEQLHVALTAARMGTWTWMIGTDRIIWSELVGPLYDKPEGWSPSSSRDYFGLIHPADRAAVSAAFETALGAPQSEYRVAYRIALASGEERWLEGLGKVYRDQRGRPSRVAGTISDVTERRRLEERVMQTHKMERLGKLSGEVAHDFNNMIAAIQGCAELLVVRGGDDPLLQTILRTTERASTLTSKLLSFARKNEVEPQLIELGAISADAIPMLSRLLGAGVTLITDLTAEDLPVRADPLQIEQVLLNLLVNARDAMPDGGEIIIRTLRTRGDDGTSRARLEVIDTGNGIPPDVLGKVFEPFFTTKLAGEGSGLGLSTCYGIVTRLGGSIEIDSEVGQGTRVVVDLELDDT